MRAQNVDMGGGPLREKILLWTSIGIVLLILGILIIWAASVGLFPGIEIQAKGPSIIPARLDLKALNLVELITRTAVVPLQMLTSALQISMQQMLGAFRPP